MIKFVNASLTYPNLITSLRNVSLHIAKQEFAFIVGPTGGGKSSLLRLIYRDAVTTSGKVFVFNRDVSTLRLREIPFHRRRIGIIFQDFLLLPQKSAYQNVAYALEIRGASSRQIRTLVPEVLEWVGLEKRMKSCPDQLSGGEQQRLCIARALVNKPDLLLADEPTGNLDPDTSVEILDLISRVNSRGTTVIVATHDEQMVNRKRARTVLLSQGRIVADRKDSGYLNIAEAVNA
ncbi:cell division ATP-binding protein FtsE [bacterium]|nr:cell division ATP-binding protein FtsE [bacterium]